MRTDEKFLLSHDVKELLDLETLGFVVLVFVLAVPCRMWDLSFLTRDWTLTPCAGRRILNHWTVKEVLAALGLRILAVWSHVSFCTFWDHFISHKTRLMTLTSLWEWNETMYFTSYMSYNYRDDSNLIIYLWKSTFLKPLHLLLLSKFTCVIAKPRRPTPSPFPTSHFPLQRVLTFSNKEIVMRMEQKAIPPRPIRWRVLLPALSTKNT